MRTIPRFALLISTGPVLRAYLMRFRVSGGLSVSGTITRSAVTVYVPCGYLDRVMRMKNEVLGSVGSKGVDECEL